MRLGQWPRFTYSLVVVTAMLSMVGCATAPTNLFQRLLHHSGAEPNEHGPAPVAYADESTANGQVTNAGYVTKAGLNHRANCQSGGG